VRRLITIKVKCLIVTRSNFPTFHLSVRIWLHFKSHQRWSPLWSWVGPTCSDRYDHQFPGSSYVSGTVLFSHE